MIPASTSTPNLLLKTDRRYDVDWLRTIALGLLIIYHIAIAFQPWGAMLFFITNKEALTGVWIPMSLLNVWRIPLLFIVSGMGVWFAMERRGVLDLMKDRTLRILIPLVFGIFVVCPIHAAIASKWLTGSFGYRPNLGHLWFLLNIFAYVSILIPLFIWMKSPRADRIMKWLKDRALVWILILAIIPISLEALVVAPPYFSQYYGTLHGWILGFICFFLGFFFVSLGSSFWTNVSKIRWATVLVAFSLFLVRLIVWNTTGPNWLTGIESGCWMLAIFGFGARYLNRPSGILRYLSAAVYPIYIIHMPVQYGISYFLMPMELSAPLKMIILIVGTFGSCFAIYETLRRLKWLRPFFGMKWNSSKPTTKLVTNTQSPNHQISANTA